MRMSLVGLGEAEGRDLGRWRELAESAVEPNPFFEPDYLLPLARTLGDLPRVALAVVAQDDSWVACLPVHRSRRWHRIPLASLSTWRGRGLLPALIGTPLVSRSCVAEATAALLSGLARSPGVFFAALDGVAEDGRVFAAVRAALAEERLWSHLFAREERAFLRRRARGGYLEQTMRSKHRRNLRARRRQLAERLGTEIELVDRSGDPEAVRELIALEGASRLAARGTVLSADPAMAGFFTEMCAAFAARDRLQLLALRAGERTLAMKCNLIADPGVFYLKIAYDEELARFSPGIQLEAEMLDLFHDRPASGWIDSCAFPSNDTFNRLFGERRALVTLTIAPRTPRTLLAAPTIRLARRLRDRAMGS